ncbi:hypothetical protein CR162_01540 [Pseudoroseomonas rhizosphaerae]|uniref:DUF4340 domain-containing protein n=1 Tax=Teichococcus rhizosphaerae TaxID=1335062 RepID=A0A2C6ZDS4_9PROT|nr:DUF4340 domain-containing protein [Pseudoroseomonas rhizosphaerae]PHK96631.1 hypothetical protein CR162_01540 [Pseudoroseomonas rhizosphaerae]
MQRRSLLILGGAALASAAAVVALGPGGPPPAATGEAPLMFRDLAARLQGAMRIEVTRHDQTLAVQRQGATSGAGDAWVLPEVANYPVRPEKVRELLVGLTELRLVEPRTANPDMLERLGLQDPEKEGSTGALLRVLDGTGAPIVALVVGRRRVRTQGNVPESVYVRREGETQSWLAEGRLPLDADPQLWIDRDLANLPRERVLRVVVQREGAPALVLARGEGPDGRLGLVEPADAPPLEQTRLDSVGSAFEFLTLTDVHRAADIPGARLGQARFTLTDNLGITVTLHEEGEAVWALLEASGDAEAERLNARWRGWAYQLGAWKRRAFLPLLDDLKAEEAPAGGAPAATPARPAP